MAEVTVAVDVYEENVPKVCWCGEPMLRAGSLCACPACGSTGVRLLFDAVRVQLDDQHTWTVPLGMSRSPWPEGKAAARG